MRENLNTQVIKDLELGVASSCDLQYFCDELRKRRIFSNIKYNFELGSSDDAYLELMLPASEVINSDIFVFSLAETIKKVIHPVIKQNSEGDPEINFLEFSRRLREILTHIKNNKKIKHSFFFTFPFKKYIWSLEDQPWVKDSDSYWIKKIEDEVFSLLGEASIHNLSLISLDEALVDVGFSEKYFRQEFWGGHPERAGAKILVDLFLEKLVGAIDLQNKIKVIALDLDNTIFNGVYLESKDFPPLNYKRMAFLKRHGDNGIPIVLVSKNNPEDSDAIFNGIKSRYPTFAEKIIGRKIGWGPKSVSIKEICADLGLSTSSVAFFDDNEFERQEVIYNASDVRVYTEDEIIPSIRYAEFSFKQVSSDARNRVEKYKNNIDRKDFENKSINKLDLNEYLKSLNFEIKFSTAKNSEFDRMEELVQRTNQQNLLLNRSSRSIIEEFILDGRAFNIFLKDRFGDYGMIGTCLFYFENDTVYLKELAISCRALGKGVENAIIAYLNNKFYTVVRKMEFPVQVNYRNKSFLENFVKNGFTFDEKNSLVSCELKKSSYPEWFSVATC